MDPFSLGIAAASAGLQFFGDYSKSQQGLSQRNRSIRFQNKARRQRTNLQNLQIADRNRYKANEYKTLKEQYQAQLGYNQQAADLAYEAESARMYDMYTQAAFKRSGLQRQLLESAGYNAAMNEGNRGRTFDRGSDMSTYGRYGGANQQLVASMLSQRGQSVRNRQNIALSQYGRNLQAFSRVAVAPYMQRQLPAPMQIPEQSSSGFNTMLQIGNAALTGLSTYSALAAPNSGNIQGFDRDRTLMGAGGGSVGGMSTLGPSFGLPTIRG